MKAGNYLRGWLLAALALPLLAVVPVLAQTPENVPTAENPNPDTVIMTTQSNLPKETLEQRLTRRKEALTNRLTTAQTNRLTSRCGAAQTRLQAVNQRAGTSIDKRQEVFGAVQTRLNDLVTKLDGRVSTTELEAAIATLAEKITAFETAGETYKQTVADLIEVKCADDPTGFKASLEAAKTEQAAVVTAAQAVRSHVQETIKPILQAIRTQLETQEAD